MNTQVRALVLGQPFTAHINHEGRLRLWRLRDETIRHRAKDDFGLLWVKRHWDTDLFVRLAMADRPMTILFIDVDDFKKVNDHPALGHIVGDEILRIVFQSVVDLVTVVGGEAYRWGGDEVTAILPDIELDVGRDVGEAIRSTVEDACGRHPKLAKTDLKVTVSVGVLGIKQRAPAREVTERASNLMKQVKRSGKNSVSASFYEDLA